METSNVSELKPGVFKSLLKAHADNTCNLLAITEGPFSSWLDLLEQGTEKNVFTTLIKEKV